MGITTVLDLLEHYPRRYVDRTQRAEISELAIGDEATVDAEVRSISARRTRDGKRVIVNATVYDGTGLLYVVFFNQAWRERQLAQGTQVSLFGKVESYRGKRQMTNPVVDVLAAPDSERGAGRSRRHRHHRVRVPAVGEGRGAHLAAATRGVVVPAAHPPTRASPIRSTARSAPTTTSSGATPRTATSTDPRRSPPRTPPRTG